MHVYALDFSPVHVDKLLTTARGILAKKRTKVEKDPRGERKIVCVQT
jgi:hypothetical protein